MNNTYESILNTVIGHLHEYLSRRLLLKTGAALDVDQELKQRIPGSLYYYLVRRCHLTGNLNTVFSPDPLSDRLDGILRVIVDWNDGGGMILSTHSAHIITNGITGDLKKRLRVADIIQQTGYSGYTTARDKTLEDLMLAVGVVRTWRNR